MRLNKSKNNNYKGECEFIKPTTFVFFIAERRSLTREANFKL